MRFSSETVPWSLCLLHGPFVVFQDDPEELHKNEAWTFDFGDAGSRQNLWTSKCAFVFLNQRIGGTNQKGLSCVCKKKTVLFHLPTWDLEYIKHMIFCKESFKPMMSWNFWTLLNENSLPNKGAKWFVGPFLLLRGYFGLDFWYYFLKRETSQTGGLSHHLVDLANHILETESFHRNLRVPMPRFPRN